MGFTEKPNWIRTECPDVKFEDNELGRLKKKVWDMSEAELDAVLEEYGIPSPSELGTPGSYIQTTPRGQLAERRKKNDIVFLPIGSTECHGDALVSGHDTFQITQFLEGVRRVTKKKGYEVNIAFPITYGGHPFHHLGMPGTIVMPHEVLMEQIIAVMLGLWNDGFRKIFLVSNHGHQWTCVSAVQEFCKRYSLPGIFQFFDFPAVCRDFFRTYTGKENEWTETFAHAGESETSLGQLMFSDMVDESQFRDGNPYGFSFNGWFDNSITDYGRPHAWYEGEGHSAIEIAATPEGVVGKQSIADPRKAKRPVVAMMLIMTYMVEMVLKDCPPGQVPPVTETTLRTEEEIAPFLKEPFTEGWRSVYAINRMSAF